MLSKFRCLGAHFPLRTSTSRLTLGMATPHCLGTRRCNIFPQPWRNVIYERANLPLRQGGIFEIDLPHTTANIKLQTTWAESAKVLLLVDGYDANYVFDDDADDDPRARVVMDTEENRLSIAEVQLSSHEDLHMQRTLDILAMIPQVCDVKVHCGSGSIRVLPKLEGSLNLSTTGNITLGIVKGGQISLACNGAFLNAKELQAQDLSLECQVVNGCDERPWLLFEMHCFLTPSPKACDVKLSLSNNIQTTDQPQTTLYWSSQMNVVGEGPLKFGSMYSNSCKIKANGPIAIGTSHGRLNVESDKGSFFVGGISGSLDSTVFLDITAHFDALGPRSKCHLTSLTGCIHASCAQDVTAGVYANGLLNVKTPNWEHETDVTTGREGKIVGVPLDSPSKWRTGGINVGAAKKHCLDQFDSGQGTTEDSSNVTATNDDEPSLMLSAEGISLETLGFMQVENLKKQHMRKDQKNKR